ncbi:hypothetical protein HHK36_025972 [Tetracentron sinense]|uniref:NAC domain-containing protein n=1 Tax=Tetracentron sinense TaxID=13715 RepID=A0A834YHW4_TETSI|nr:hypothetical protein HHK36_025972 [Tetracentron sinense]
MESSMESGMELVQRICREDDWKSCLPPGMKFQPTDQELLINYLYAKVIGFEIPYGIIKDIDVYKFEPFDLQEMAFDHGDGKLYFFTPRHRKYGKGMRPSRSTPHGYWKATGKMVNIGDIGNKTSLVYYHGKLSNTNDENQKTKWLMTEYKLPEWVMPSKNFNEGSKVLDDCVICKIYLIEKKVKITTDNNNTPDASTHAEGIIPVSNASLDEQRLKALTCAPRSPRSLDAVLLVSSPTPGKRDMSRIQYYGCKKFGHLATAFKESPICAFCKIRGHSIQECRKKKQAQGKVYMTTTDDSSTSVMAPPPPSTPLTPKMVQ